MPTKTISKIEDLPLRCDDLPEVAQAAAAVYEAKRGRFYH